MPDTGAPWNIPYVAPSDLVSAWPTANQTMAESVADALDIVQSNIRPLEVGGESSNTSMSPSASRNITFTFAVGRFSKAPVVAPSYFHSNLSYSGPRLTGAATTSSVTFNVVNESGASQTSRLWYIAIQED